MIDQDNINCTEEEKQHRIVVCGTCEDNILDVIPKCKHCQCPISSITMMKFKTCPLEKW